MPESRGNAIPFRIFKMAILPPLNYASRIATVLEQSMPCRREVYAKPWIWPHFRQWGVTQGLAKSSTNFSLTTGPVPDLGLKDHLFIWKAGICRPRTLGNRKLYRASCPPNKTENPKRANLQDPELCCGSIYWNDPDGGAATSLIQPTQHRLFGGIQQPMGNFAPLFEQSQSAWLKKSQEDTLHHRNYLVGDILQNRNTFYRFRIGLSVGVTPNRGLKWPYSLLVRIKYPPMSTIGTDCDFSIALGRFQIKIQD